MEYFILLFSCVLIVKSADWLVDSATSVALRLKVPKILIALTIVAFGTCAPELGISFNSIINGNDSIALANVVGSCIINILMIIGVASFLHPIKLKHQTIRKELPLLALITCIFSILVLDSIYIPSKHGIFTRTNGMILLLLFLIFITYLLNMLRTKKDEEEVPEKPRYSMIKSLAILLFSIVLIVYSSDLLVDNAVIIANNLGISEKIITMVVIVIGTSLPELVMTVRAAAKKEYDIAIGNIIGTNIFNICVVLGLPITLFNGITIVDFGTIDMLVVLISTVILYFFSRSGKVLSRVEGLLMFLIFVFYYMYILLV